MKKIAMTIAIVLGLSVASFAQGGLFQRGEADEYTYFYHRTDAPNLILPYQHGLYNNQDAPLGSGVVMLLGLGAAYLVGKKRKEE